MREDANASQTSALDTHTEQALMSNITSILKEKQRTSVFVAHRLRTIFDADQIIVLENGTVAESPGTHDSLVNAGGVYSRLWRAQETTPVVEKALGDEIVEQQREKEIK